MSTELVRMAQVTGFDPAKIELVKDTLARGASDDELMLFLTLAKRSGLDPFSRQIYLIERRQQIDGQWKTSRQPQTGIDGLRLIADRTGRYAPGRAPTFDYDNDGNLVSATAYVMKLAADRWFETAATAHYREYVQTRKDGTPTQMWAEKPHIMLAKCAEALALRRAFPADMSGLYTPDEIPGDPVVDVTPAPDRRARMLDRIAGLTRAADALDLEIVLTKPLDQMTDAELTDHGKRLREAVDAAAATAQAAATVMVDAVAA